MLEAQIPKDIRRYDAKFLGPFTLRQLICFIVAAVLSVVVYTLTNEVLGKTMAIYLCLLLAIPEILIGWVKIQGIDFEKFVKTAMVTVLGNKTRVYKVNNPYRMAGKTFVPLSEKEYKKVLNKYNKKKKKGESVIERYQ